MAPCVLLPGREPSLLPNDHQAFPPVLAPLKNTLSFFDTQKVCITALLRCCGLYLRHAFGWRMLCCYSAISKSLLMHARLTKGANESIHSPKPSRPCSFKGLQKTKVKRRKSALHLFEVGGGWISLAAHACLSAHADGEHQVMQSNHTWREHFWIATHLITKVQTSVHCTSMFQLPKI